jgi:GTP cyclohydrolase I
MRDVQNQADSRNVPISKVGVKNVHYPLTVLDKKHKVQPTTGTVDLYADLPHHFKGTHMSRFIEVFHKYHENVSMKNFLHMLDEVRQVLDAEHAYGEIRFPYYVEKLAPVSGQASIMQYQCAYSGEVGRLAGHGAVGRGAAATRNALGEERSVPEAREHRSQVSDKGDDVPGPTEVRRFFVSIEVPVMTLCPCSKEISDRGAHNQRSFVRLRLQMGTSFFWIEDIIELVESCASSGLYTLLKREDERYITEYSYDHPVFVEDLVRETTVRLEALGIVPWFTVEAENLESIHNHEAYAFVERGAMV